MTAQAGLGVVDAGPGGEREGVPGEGIADATARRHSSGESASAQHHVDVTEGESVGHPHDVGNSVLAITVGADDIGAGMGGGDVGEPGLEGGTLPPVDAMGEDGGPGHGDLGKEVGVCRAAPVVHDDHRVVGRCDECVDEHQEAGVGLVGRDEDDHGRALSLRCR